MEVVEPNIHPMKQILSELNNSNSVLLEKDQLPEFLDYCTKQKDFYSFRYEYFENHVKITMVGKETIIKIGHENDKTQTL